MDDVSGAQRALKERIRAAGSALGLSAIGFGRAKVPPAWQEQLHAWLEAGRHGAMDYMARHAALRGDPAALHAGTQTVISARLAYWPEEDHTAAEQVLANLEKAYISRYALGRDYHKTLRAKLTKLAEQLPLLAGHPVSSRPFVDSAPVMEVDFAARAGLGWRGKHTLLLTRQGSWHFLGEIYTDLDLPPDPEPPLSGGHCGRCTRCLDLCPTKAIIAPYQVDARRCISYLTIEHPGSIPEELRPLMGNRIYGCDDCQLVCPWNRFARSSHEPDFAPRHGLDAAQLAELMRWSEHEFADRLAGSPIRRIGIERWRRNLAVGLGNAPGSPEVIGALAQRTNDPSPVVRSHVAWALARHGTRLISAVPPAPSAHESGTL